MTRGIAWTPAEVAAFADALADGKTIPVAAATVSRNRFEGRNQFSRMRRQLGPQAV